MWGIVSGKFCELIVMPKLRADNGASFILGAPSRSAYSVGRWISGQQSLPV